ncbi:MAG: hypothetical protein V2J07_02680 [Anaerolineae bacterium]|jgi:hypothetical protein|nr:hypothetical protein [Anaerolineae bacterium]
MKKNSILVVFTVLLVTAMACNITNLFSGNGQEEDQVDEVLSDLAIALTEAAAVEEEEEAPQQEEAPQNNQPEPTTPPLPTNTPFPTNTPAPTNTPEPVYSNPGMITEKDYVTDFSFNDGWFDYYTNGAGYDVNYTGDAALINIRNDYTYVYLFQEDLYYYPGEAVYVETTIEVNDGAYNNNLGVTCRVTDEGWYEFLIRTNGYWDLYIFDVDSSQYQHLDTGGSWDINMKYAENTIGMLCDGDEMTLYINGVKVKTVRNDVWDEGGVGLNVGTLEYGGSEFEVKSFYAINDMSMLNLPD